MKDEKIGENDKCIFYKNMFTTDFKDGFKIVMVKTKKNGYQEYLLIKNDKPIYASQKIENIWSRHDLYKLIKRKR